MFCNVSAGSALDTDTEEEEGDRNVNVDETLQPNRAWARCNTHVLRSTFPKLRRRFPMAKGHYGMFIRDYKDLRRVPIEMLSHCWIIVKEYWSAKAEQNKRLLAAVEALIFSKDGGGGGISMDLFAHGAAKGTNSLERNHGEYRKEVDEDSQNFDWHRNTRNWKPNASQFLEMLVTVTLPRESRANKHQVFEKCAMPSRNDIKDAKMFAKEPDFLLVSTNEANTSAAYRQKSEKGKLYEMDPEWPARAIEIWHSKPNCYNDFRLIMEVFFVNANGNWPNWGFSSKQFSIEHLGFRIRLKALGADIPMINDRDAPNDELREVRLTRPRDISRRRHVKRFQPFGDIDTAENTLRAIQGNNNQAEKLQQLLPCQFSQKTFTKVGRTLHEKLHCPKRNVCKPSKPQ